MGQAMECPECGIAIIGETLDLLEHFDNEHPLHQLFIGEDGDMTVRERIVQVAIRETFKADYTPTNNL